MSQIASMTKRKHSEYVTQLAITEATRKERKELQELLLVEMGALELLKKSKEELEKELSHLVDLKNRTAKPSTKQGSQHNRINKV